jgi:hypothetical protein
MGLERVWAILLCWPSLSDARSIDMLETIGPLIAAIKNAGPPIYGAVFMATTLLLFLPDPIIMQLGLAEFKQLYRSYAGIALIASASLLSVYLLSALTSFASIYWEDWRLSRKGLKTLRELTNDEKNFLRPFIVDGNNTQYVELSDGIATGLAGKRLIYRASQVSVPGSMEFAYNLQPFARRLLTRHRHLLD